MQIETCEVCERKFVAGYGYSLAVCWLVTGSAHVTAYMCSEAGSSGQHWGCTPEHAMQAIVNCLQEHMHVDSLKAKHEVAHKDRPRYSDEDAHWADEAHKKRGEDFHIVDVSL